MRILYDAKADAIVIDLSDKKPNDSVDLNENVSVDLYNGSPVFISLHNVSRYADVRSILVQFESKDSPGAGTITVDKMEKE